MANPEHVAILEQGVEVWNKWREENPDVRPDLREADLIRAKLRETDLNGANLIGADLYGTNLSGANLHLANLVLADLRGAKLSEANLRGANLSEANLDDANLTGADLAGVNFLRTNLHLANLSGASLNFTLFSESIVYKVNFSKTRLFKTIFANMDLSIAMGMEDVIHYGPSSISFDTLIRSRGQIPEVFLRGAGVPDKMIIFMKSLTQEDVIQFYTCFISYTEADDLISERLYNDLQVAGVRCWRWREDAHWGKTLMKSVDEAVRMYDKLVVICSEKSLQAPPVIREIERALQKEDRLEAEGKEGEVLFPIRLDDYIFEGWEHHRKADVVAKNVGDFQEWEDPNKYKDAFDRLLQDLREDHSSKINT